jgi:acetate kinase
MASLTPRFSANRAVGEYTEQHYLPAAAAYRKRAADKGTVGKNIANWEHALKEKWPTLRFGDVKVQTNAAQRIFGIIMPANGRLRARNWPRSDCRMTKESPMKPTNPRILTINGGSSSIKFALFEAGNLLRRILEGEIERIGLPEATWWVKGLNQADNFSRPVAAPDHTVAADVLMDWIEERSGRDALTAVGHRLVRGGPKYSQPERITPEMVEEMRQLSAFDPDHLPEEILLTEAFHRRFPDLPQVACFDTAFHRDLPRVALLLPIPRRYEAQGVRRYGFHGLSYAFLMGELARLAGTEAAQGRVILAHLGNGASLAAVRDGKPVDTSMSFTPTAGVPMSSRSGDLDPGLVWYLARTEGLDARRFNEMVNLQSGLLGVSETSSDMRDLLEHERQDVRAAEAVALFCYQVKKWIGAFAAALGGLDTLVFAAGIGENAPTVRARICDGLGFLGIQLDEKRNTANEGVISAAASRVAVRVIHTDEECMIAKTVCSVLGLG